MSLEGLDADVTLTPRSAGQIIRTHMDLSLERYSNMYQIQLIYNNKSTRMIFVNYIISD